MMKSPFIYLALVAALSGCKPDGAGKSTSSKDGVAYIGVTDGSAAVMLDAEHFISAYDEDSVLRIYNKSEGGAPVNSIDLSGFLANGGEVDTDIEGAARIGQRLYWISSHAQSKNGKPRPSQRQLFALAHEVANGKPSVKPIGKSYTRLVEDLIADPRFAEFNFAAASQKAPKEDGALCIEGLSAGPGNSLWIGFRNPVPKGMAVMIPLLNPDEVMINGAKPIFGDAQRLALGGLGIRDVAYAENRYWIIGGPHDGKGKSRLFVWAGDATAPREFSSVDLKGFNAEAILSEGTPSTSGIVLLSDDSGEDAKELTFHGRHISAEQLK